MADADTSEVIDTENDGIEGTEETESESPPLFSLRQTLIIGLMVLLVCIIIGVVAYYFLVVRKKASAPPLAPPVPVPAPVPAPPPASTEQQDFTLFNDVTAQQLVIPFAPETGGVLRAEKLDVQVIDDVEGIPGMKCLKYFKNGEWYKKNRCGCYPDYSKLQSNALCLNFNAVDIWYGPDGHIDYNIFYPQKVFYYDVPNPPHICTIAQEPTPSVPDTHISVLYTGDFTIDGNYYPLGADLYHKIGGPTVIQVYNFRPGNQYGFTVLKTENGKVYFCNQSGIVGHPPFIPQIVRYNDLSTTKNFVLGQLARCNLFMVPKRDEIGFVARQINVHGYYHRTETPTVYMGVDDTKSIYGNNKGMFLYVVPNSMPGPILITDPIYFESPKGRIGTPEICNVGDKVYFYPADPVQRIGSSSYEGSDYKLIVKNQDKSVKLYESFWNNGNGYMKFDPITL